MRSIKQRLVARVMFRLRQGGAKRQNTDASVARRVLTEEAFRDARLPRLGGQGTFDRPGFDRCGRLARHGTLVRFELFDRLARRGTFVGFELFGRLARRTRSGRLVWCSGFGTVGLASFG